MVGQTFVQVRRREPRGGDSLEWGPHVSDESWAFGHVHLLGLNLIRWAPREMVEQMAQHGGDEIDTELGAGTHPTTGPKGEQPEIMTLHVNVLLEEAFGSELKRVFPKSRVTSNGPDVNVDVGALWDVVAADLDVGVGFVGKHEGGGWVQAQGFLGNALEVGKAGEVGLGEEPLEADDSVELLLGLELDPGVLDELGHGPFDGDGGGVHAGGDHVPEEAYDGVVAEVILGLESEQSVDEVVLGGATRGIAGPSVLVHDGPGETVPSGAVLGESFFLEREHPAQPADVLCHGQGGPQLESIGHNCLEFHSLLVHYPLRIHKPLPKCQSCYVVECHCS